MKTILLVLAAFSVTQCNPIKPPVDYPTACNTNKPNCLNN